MGSMFMMDTMTAAAKLATLNQQETEILGQKKNVEETATNLVQSFLGSNAPQAFTDAQTAWDEGMKTMIQGLDAMEALLANNVNSYQRSDEDGASIFRIQ